MGPYFCNLRLNILPVQMWTSSTLGGQIRRWSFWTMGRRLRWEGHMTSCLITCEHFKTMTKVDHMTSCKITERNLS